MKLREYQDLARETDQRPGGELEDIVVHLLGLAGEAGSVAEQYKKRLRDKDAHLLWKARMREEMGDLLWYIAAIATDLGLDLDEVARANIEKTRNRWLVTGADQLDAAFPLSEQLPRKGTYEFRPSLSPTGRPRMRVRFEGQWIGDPLTDAAHIDDGYRFHDVFHLAHAVVLGWSPVTRQLLKRKRRSIPEIDEAEDGGRAIVIEEGVAALVFAYAANHDYLVGVNRLDQQLLDTVQMLTTSCEVGVRSAGDWERAILVGYSMFHQLRSNEGGDVLFDADVQTMSFVPFQAG